LKYTNLQTRKKKQRPRKTCTGIMLLAYNGDGAGVAVMAVGKTRDN